jgi:acyl-CoA dehydrogenase family protein 9
VEAATEPKPPETTDGEVSSFAKSLFLGEIAEDLVFPWPQADAEEQQRIRELIAAAHEIGASMDLQEMEEKRWIGDDTIRRLGEAGLCGLYVPTEYGGQGLSQTGYARVFETFAQIDGTLSIVLGEPGDGFRIAMQILNNGRIGLGTGSVGATKGLLDRAIEHVNSRRQFGQPLADFELVQEKIAWMVSYLFGLESMCYLTCGLVDNGVPDYSLESAMCKVSGTEFLWYAANRTLQLAGGEGYMRDQPYEKILRDIRIFPIFEGANDVMRAFVALSGMKPVGEKLSGLGEIGLGDPIGSIGVLLDYVGERFQQQVSPDKVTKAHPELEKQANDVSEQVAELRSVTEGLLRKHRKGIMERQLQQKRLADSVSDIYAQIAVLSRVTSIFEDQGVEPSGQERYIADTFCTRASERVRSRLRQTESNDDERMTAIAKLAYKRGEYGYALFQD